MVLFVMTFDRPFNAGFVIKDSFTVSGFDEIIGVFFRGYRAANRDDGFIIYGWDSFMGRKWQ